VTDNRRDITSLTMQDIAELAGVSRPAVSMWRRRPRVHGRIVPFPSPAAVVGGVERFDRDEVVSWLRETGRGNNPEHEYDAPAFSAPIDVAAASVSVLLCLHALGVEQFEGETRAALTAVAEEADPGDRFVLREARALDLSPSLLRYADDLIEASYGPADALARLDAGRLRRESGERGLSGELIEIVRAVLDGCRTDLGDGAAVAPFGDERLVAVSEGFAGLVFDADPPNEVARALHRRAVIAGLDVLEPGLPGSLAAASGIVRVGSVVGMEPEAALETVDEVALQLGPTDAAVVVGPAAVLCDRLRGEREQRRAQTLRGGNLVLALRLPRGLWKQAHRQSLGLWVLRGGVVNQRPRVADLSAERMDVADRVNDLAADVTGALELTEGRAYRYARAVSLAPILAGGVVVPRGIRALRLGLTRAVDHVDRVQAASLVTSAPVPAFDVLVGEAPGSIVLSRRSLGELRDAGHLRLKRGSRIDPADADPDGTVRVLSAERDGDGVRLVARLDPLDAERHYGRAVRTEPGDVVFAERPRPQAFVDEAGGAIVASPSRILRLTPSAPVGPWALAAIINDLPADSTSAEWETWTVPELPRGDAGALDETLRRIDGYAAELRQRLSASDELRRALMDGFAAGTVTLDHALDAVAPSQTDRRAG